MICKKCGCEKLDVINVFRNRKKHKDKWTLNGDYDTRLVICTDCGTRFFTETTFLSELYYDEHKLKLFERDKQGNLFLYTEGKEN